MIDYIKRFWKWLTGWKGKTVVAAVMLAASSAVYADPLVNCLSGCPEKGAKLRAEGDTQVASTLWLGPAVGLALAGYDSATHTWQSSIAFNLSYGLYYRPAFWTATPSFASFNVGLAAGTADVTSPTFSVTLAPTVTFLNWISVGYGPRFRVEDGGIKTSGVFFLGLTTSLGGP